MSTRQPMSHSGEGENAAPAEPRPKTVTPIMSSFSLPYRSPRLPNAISSEPTAKP
jgi:hypothetical protein